VEPSCSDLTRSPVTPGIVSKFPDLSRLVHRFESGLNRHKSQRLSCYVNPATNSVQKVTRSTSETSAMVCAFATTSALALVDRSNGRAKHGGCRDYAARATE